MPPYNSSDPTAGFVGSSCLDFLLIEMVPMAYRVANEVEAQALEAAAYSMTAAAAHSPRQRREAAAGGGGGGEGGVDGGGAQPSASAAPNSHAISGIKEHGAAAAAPLGGSVKSSAGTHGGGSTRKMDEEEERDAVFYRLEMLGYRVGQGLAERYVKSAGIPQFAIAATNPDGRESLACLHAMQCAYAQTI